MMKKYFANNVVVFAGLFCLNIISATLFSALGKYLGIDLDNMEDTGLSATEMVVVIVFIAPLLETFFCQYLIFELFTKGLKLKNDIVCLLLMSLIFALLHHYNWLYMVAAFVGGVLLNTLYIILRKRIGGVRSFFLTVLFHVLYNSLAEIVNHYTS
ncbi:MAG: CPBP family intramembrane metalloprotease [Dysgonamonadaceae bacterium]|jgi:membrane protease YdiL (CAAX protease family)|nr:CPBP family intramembrane metalloprotease [Dysgonamonadaceae bacterium]